MIGRFLSLRFIVFLCLGLRLLFLIFMQPWAYTPTGQISIHNDSPLYHKLACSLLDQGGFISDGLGGPPHLKPVEIKGYPDNLRTPIYPLFIAGIYGVFGRMPWIVFVVQILIDVLTCALLYISLKRSFGEKPAAIAAIFYALDPHLILCTSALLTETLFVFAMVGLFAVYIFLVKDKPGRVRVLGYALLGMIAGWSALLRPIAQFLPLGLAVFIMWTERKAMKIALPGAVLLIAASLLALSPWMVRNYRLFGTTSLTYIGSWDLYGLNVGMMEAAKRGTELKPVIEELLAEADQLIVSEGNDPRKMNYLQKAKVWQHLAFRYILQDPIRFGYYHVLGMAEVLISPGTGDFARTFRLPSVQGNIKNAGKRELMSQGLFALWIIPLLIITYGGAIIGFITAWRQYHHAVLWLCLLMILYFISLTGALGVVRLKVPSIPFYLAFAGLGWVYLESKILNRTNRG